MKLAPPFVYPQAGTGTIDLAEHCQTTATRLPRSLVSTVFPTFSTNCKLRQPPSDARDDVGGGEPRVDDEMQYSMPHRDQEQNSLVRQSLTVIGARRECGVEDNAGIGSPQA